jgi:hypothetical protein
MISPSSSSQVLDVKGEITREKGFSLGAGNFDTGNRAKLPLAP